MKEMKEMELSMKELEQVNGGETDCLALAFFMQHLVLDDEEMADIIRQTFLQR